MTHLLTRKHFLSWRIAYFSLGLVVLYFLLRQIDFGDLVGLIVKIKPRFLALGGFLYLCKGIIRSLRLARLNAAIPMRFIKILRLTFASSLASQLLPMKIGELSYVYLLNKEKDATLSQGFSSLMVLRLIDMLAISLLFLGIGLSVRLPAEFLVYFRSILIFFGCLLVSLLGLLVISKKDQVLVRFFAKIRWVNRIALFKGLVRTLENFLSALKPYTGATYFEGIILACGEWLINYAVFHVVLLGIGMSPTFFATIVSVTFAALASILPISSFGSFGTQEAGWATGLILMGYTKELAITSGFATHLVTLAYMLLFGGISWLSYIFKFIRRGRPEVSNE